MTALAVSIESPEIHRRESQKMLRLHKPGLSAQQPSMQRVLSDK